MANSSGKKKSAPPTGYEHSPEAVASRKRRTLARFMAELSPKLVGSAKYRRRKVGR